MSAVICKLPRAGLGNQLFPLMHAAVFASLNKLPLLVTGYRQLKLGPYLRGEKSKRYYVGYFNFEKGLLTAWQEKWKAAALQKRLDTIEEPALSKLSPGELTGKVFVFEEMTTYHDYFGRLKPHRELALQLFYQMLSPVVQQQVQQLAIPTIGVHLRMGDFRKLAKGEEFRGGHVRTPDQYFIQLIQALRKQTGKQLPVTIFTDGHAHECENIIALGEVAISKGNSDLMDLIQLSKSKLIILSTGSTFSAWAGFLSNSPLIKHPDHLHRPFRPEQINATAWEGPYEAANEKLAGQINNI